MFFRDGRMCLKKDERRGWSYDCVVEMINGVVYILYYDFIWFFVEREWFVISWVWKNCFWRFFYINCNNDDGLDK